tara:strand:- start:222 stop:824 length:603 start_codon:yes stop_codon:yes gene_type:complete
MEYKDLAWLTYRLAATFFFGLPLVLLAWASIKKKSAILRLLYIYWKVSSLIPISILLLTSNQPIGYLTSFAAPLLITCSLWFWIDLNEEINEMSSVLPLELTTKIWRWTISFLGIFYSGLTFMSLSCFKFLDNPRCTAWIQGPQNLHGITKVVLNFLFGGNWTEALAGFIGYIVLIAYLIGLLQWLIIRLPKNGRIAGYF